MKARLAVFTCAAAVVAVVLATARTSDPAQFTVVDRKPHDATSFTQGLEMVSETVMAESSGGYGSSSVRLHDIDTGEQIDFRSLPSHHFAEGITVVDTTLVQGTWKSGVVHVWDIYSLDAHEPHGVSGETWGLCYDDTRDVVWRSDGSSTVHAHDPRTFDIVGMFDTDTRRLNELECVEGLVWANVWHTDDIVVLDPDRGRIHTYGMSSLVRRAESDNGSGFGSEQVLNGIAHHAGTGRFYLTGKQWPYIYVVDFDTSFIGAQ